MTSSSTLVDIVLRAESIFFFLLIAAIIVQSILSMIVPQGVRRLSALLYDLTTPIISPIRQVIPPFGMLDLSPMFAILLLIIGGWIVENITSLLAGG